MTEQHSAPQLVAATEGSSSFSFEGRELSFAGPRGEHVLRVIDETGSFYEAAVLLLLRTLLAEPGRPGIVVDVGAMIGNHAVFFGLLGRPVLAFEPHSQTFEYLARNLRRNEATNVEPVNAGVGAAPGRARIVEGAPDSLGTTSLALDGSGDVPIVTLDEVVADRRVALIKVDVEGGELAVLAGAAGTIARDRPILSVEAQDGLALRRILDLLPDGYAIVECFAPSGTYVLRADGAHAQRRWIANGLWLARAHARQPRVREMLRRVARFLA